MNKAMIITSFAALSMILSCALDDKKVCNPGEWGCINNDLARCNDGFWEVEIYCEMNTQCDLNAQACIPMATENLECKPNEHIYLNSCENDDENNCGQHGYSCHQIENSINAKCSNGQCEFECNEGYHVYNQICEPNSPNQQYEFISVWLVPDSNLQINFPLQGIENTVTIDWGDTNKNIISSNNINYAPHLYNKAGKYTIIVRGKLTNWSCKSNLENASFCDGLVEIQSYGETTFGTYTFYRASKLQKLPNIITPKFANNSMENIFSYASTFNQDISFWNTSNITNMNGAFKSASAFNQPLDQWNTSNVTNMSEMFQYASAFNQPLNNWDTSNVTDMSKMFQNASAFNQSINDWDTSSVTNMSSMFNWADAFDQPLNNWDTSNVTDVSEMFQDAYAFNQTLNNWNTSNVTNMSGMFNNAITFNKPIDQWNTSNVTNMAEMFNNATEFNQPLDNWNTSNVINMKSMFEYASNFNQPLNNWDTSNITDMSHMFECAIAFNQPLNNWNTSNVKDMESMFKNATVFNQSLAQWNISNTMPNTNPNANLYDIFSSSGLDQDNYCALFSSSYALYWESCKDDLGIYYYCKPQH